MRRTGVTLVACLILILVALFATLSEAPPTVAHASSNLEEDLGNTSETHTLCQANELLPAGTTAVRVQLATFSGPQLKLAVFAGSRRIAGGERASNWTGHSATIPLRPVPRSSSRVRLCVKWVLPGAEESVFVFGARTDLASAATIDGSPERGRMGIEYLRPGSSSWFSLIPNVARRLGLGRSPSGTGIAVLAAILMLAVVALSCRFVLVELR